MSEQDLPFVVCLTMGRPNTWPVPDGEPSVLANDMTLVIAALASDGVVIGSDTRETIRSDWGDTYEDDHVKVFSVGENMIVGVAGAAAWAKQEIGNVRPLNPRTPADLCDALLLRLRSDANIPPASIVVASADPAPTLLYIDKRAGAWTPPVVVDDRPMTVGIPMLAKWFMRALYVPTMTVREVAAVIALAICESSKVCPNIGGGTVIMARRTTSEPWTEQDTAEAISNGKDLMKKMVLSVRRV